MSAFALVIAPAFAVLADAARVPSCLEGCDLTRNPQIDCCTQDRQPCLNSACGNYKTCRGAADAKLDEDIAGDDDCAPRSTKGQCTIVLGCVRKHQAVHRKEVKRCERVLANNLESDEEDACNCDISRRARRLAARVCRACTSATTVTVTTVATETTTVSTTTTDGTTTTQREPFTDDDEIDGCMDACILRLDSMADCYDRCDDHCKGNKRALAICRRGCRNGGCKAIKARCSNDGDNKDDAFRICHRRKGTPRPSKDEAPCRITSTTTSTTTTTSTSTTTGLSTTSTTSAQVP